MYTFLAKPLSFPEEISGFSAMSASCWWSCHLDLSEPCAESRNCHVWSHLCPLELPKGVSSSGRVLHRDDLLGVGLFPILPLLFDLFPWGFGVFKPWQSEGWVELNRRLSLFQVQSQFLGLTFKLNPAFKLDELYWRVDLGVAVKSLWISLFPPVPAVCINPSDVPLFPWDLRVSYSSSMVCSCFQQTKGGIECWFWKCGMWLESLDHAVVDPECCKGLVILHSTLLSL